MDQNTATPQPDWAALGWIAHRQPTEADADGLNEVVVPDAIDATPRKGKARTCDYRLIVPGQPWWSVFAASTEPAEPAPTASRRVVQITGGDNCLIALCNDGTLLRWAAVVGWTELPAIPQP